jgi:hypothetical protein
MRQHRRRPIGWADVDAILRDIHLPDITDLLFGPSLTYTWLARKR